MSDLQKSLKKIISDIEHNLKNKEDLEYVKTQIYNMRKRICKKDSGQYFIVCFC